MNWGAPVWLWVLLAPAIAALGLIVSSFLGRRQSPRLWPGMSRVIAVGATIHPAPPRRGARRPWLLLAAITGGVLALARPQWGEEEQTTFQHAREVMLALDLSRSMLVEDIPPSRLGRAVLLIRSLLDSLQGERVGLIVFAGTAFVQVPLSADYQILEEFLPELKPDYMPQGGTDYTDMLRSAVKSFSQAANTDRYLIVLSDGESTTKDWRQQLPALRERDIHVIALGVGTAAGALIPDPKGGYVKDDRGAVVLSRLEPDTLQALARETRGTYRDASSWVDLPAVLAQTVERGREGRFTEQRTVRHIERFQWFLAPAVALALLGIWREIAVRPRVRQIRRQANATPRARSASSGATPRTAGAALLLVLSLALAAPPAAHAVVTVSPPPEGAPPNAPVPAPSAPVPGQLPSAPNPPANPSSDPAEGVRETIARLSRQSRHTAADWHELARRSLAYGTDARSKKQPLETGVIADALAAVDRGEKLDAGAADWPKLRQDLQRLLEPPPEQKPPEQKPPPQQKQDENQKQQQEQQNQDQQQGGQPPGQKDDQQKQDQESGSPPSDQSGDSKPQDSTDSGQQPQHEQGRPPQKTDTSSQPEAPQKQSPDNQDGQSQQTPPSSDHRPGDQLGQLQNPAEKPSPPAEPRKKPAPTRKIVSQRADETPVNPADAAALQQLRQATRADAPARLFELLEGDSGKPEPSGPDW